MSLATVLWLEALVIATIVWSMALAGALWVRARLPRLSDLPDTSADGRWPRLSVVVPSRDEAAGVERATLSLLDQDYPGLEIVAVDDRSTDATGRILDGLASRHERLSVVHVRELPEGWLGKNHASHVGASAASGEWLLFTDGDVVFHAGALRRAMSYALSRGLGHLAVVPQLVAPQFLERAFVAAFTLLMSLKFQVWKLGRPRTGAYIGLGAFNLVRREDYERVGGHRRLAMEVVDDLKLGLVLRRSGVRQGVLLSGGLVAVRWSRGVVATARGLLKNSFAGVEWRWRQMLYVQLVVVIAALLPVLAVLAAPLPSLRLFALVPVMLALGLHAGTARRLTGGSGLEGLVYVLTDLVLVAVGLWSAASATLRGGIEWRGTRYPLEGLRKGCVRERDWPVSSAVGWE